MQTVPSGFLQINIEVLQFIQYFFPFRIELWHLKKNLKNSITFFRINLYEERLQIHIMLIIQKGADLKAPSYVIENSCRYNPFISILYQQVNYRRIWLIVCPLLLNLLWFLFILSFVRFHLGHYSLSGKIENL